MSSDFNLPNGFARRAGSLFCEDAQVSDLAELFGTPLYIYSQAAITEAFLNWTRAFGDARHLVCYAVKANSNIAILRLLASLGSGFDIVSGGELERVLAAGGDATKVVFSGVGKSTAEIRRALEVGIRCFNVESSSELYLIEKIASERGEIARISIRINPDVDAKTHPYISTGLKENKFGVNAQQALGLYRYAQDASHLQPVGIDCHIGSQLTEVAPFVESVQHLRDLVLQLRKSGINIEHIDIGGGLGIQYSDEAIPSPLELISAVRAELDPLDTELMIEPGRSIVGNAGALLTKVLVEKAGDTKYFAVVDAAMNDLLRPALYSAWQNIVEVSVTQGSAKNTYDIVGPVCETGDFLGKERRLTAHEGDLLAVMGAGAYSFSMSSNYNTRPRAAEILVHGSHTHIIRQRETLSSLWQDEQIPEALL
jgi:diaminopimelate decarboxylase